MSWTTLLSHSRHASIFGGLNWNVFPSNFWGQPRRKSVIISIWIIWAGIQRKLLFIYANTNCNTIKYTQFPFSTQCNRCKLCFHSFRFRSLLCVLGVLFASPFCVVFLYLCHGKIAIPQATHQPIFSSLENNIRRITVLSYTAHTQRILEHPEHIIWRWRNG